MDKAWPQWLHAANERLSATKRLRSVHVNENDELNITEFSSNDYLGLARHDEVRSAASDAALRHGMGPRGSALVCGYTAMHRDLELELARLKGAEECLLTPSGFAANTSAIAALARDGGVHLFSDQLNHASIVDGCRLASIRCPVSIYRHNDAGHLSELARAAHEPRALLVTDTLFSMDGDVAPFDELSSAMHGAFGSARSFAVADEAHATLCYGTRGEGLAPHGFADICVGTLSKAVGAHGGFVTCSRDMKQYLLSTMRGLVFSTALPIPVIAAASTAVRIGTGEEGEELRRRLHANARSLRSALHTDASAMPSTHIVPLRARGGGEAAALDAAAYLMNDARCNVKPIRPPTVPVGTARVRVALSATHTAEQVARLARAASACPHLDVSSWVDARL